MADMKTEKRTLMVTGVEQPIKKDRQDGKGTYQILSFMAKDGNETHTYKTFNQSFFEFIKPEAVIDVDVKTEEKGDYINRTIVQLYQDGKPIAESKGGWSSGKGGGYSIEAEKLKQESTAASYVKDIWLAGKISDTDPLVTALRHWLSEKLGLKAETLGKGQPAPAKTSESQPAKPSKANDDDLFGDTPELDTVKLLADFKKLPAATRAGLVKLYGITSWEHWDEVILALPADKQQALMKAVYGKETK